MKTIKTNTMKNILTLLLLVTLSSFSQRMTQVDKFYLENTIETNKEFEGRVFRIGGAYDFIGYESSNQAETITMNNPYYTGYLTVSEGKLYSCSRKGVIKSLYANEGYWMKRVEGEIFYITNYTYRSAGEYKGSGFIVKAEITKKK
tara:strand:+ start:2758 stop:3195 length:438 start_codon:yes stop_codon:yes gene_type:complete